MLIHINNAYILTQKEQLEITNVKDNIAIVSKTKSQEDLHLGRISHLFLSHSTCISNQGRSGNK